MRILVTGYSRQHTSTEHTGTFASLLAASLRLAGHFVVQAEPDAVMEDDFDHFLIGVDSPLAVTSRTALSALSMIAELAGTSKLTLFMDDPNLRKIGSSHQSVIDTPERAMTDYLRRNRSAHDVAIFDSAKRRPTAMRGADIIANPHQFQVTCLYPQHSWAPAATSTLMPGGITTALGVDMTWLLLRPDAVLDMGMEAHELGAIAKNRAEVWPTSEYTTSRSSNLWIAQVKSNIVQPTIKAVNVRQSLIEGFCQALLSLGVLEQPPSPTVTGWWTPWLPLAIASGGYYATEDSRAMGAAFAVLPSQFENLTDEGRRAVITQQRDTVRQLISEWSPERVAGLVLAKESIRG